MDFNQILLFASLGLLALVMLFALWGFLAGLKRELKCTVVFLVLLVLAWLVFGNSGVLLNLNGGLVDAIRNALNLPAKDATVWETILDYLKSMEGLNLEPLLEEGKETYNLIYNIASAVVSFVLLMGATLVVVIITPIIRLITHIVGLIIKGVKDKKAKESSDEPGEVKDPEAEDAVLVLKGAEKSDNAVVTLSENKLPPKEKTKQRVWGAVTGALKCILLIIVLFAPISGIYSIGSSISDPTRDLISDLVDGDSSDKTNVSESTSMTDTVFDIIDAYGNSGIGKFVEGSSYFFGDSFSTLLFDSMANITTEKQHIKIREELIVFIDAVNELNGNIELGTWSNEEVAKLLDVLKDSKLLPEIMPVVIEYASEVPAIKEALMKAVQESSFLTLRDIDWDKDIEKVLDALKHVYALDVFASDLNVLKLDAEEVEKALSILGETELINKLFPIVLKTAVKLEQVEELIGTYTGNLDVNEIDWQKELVSLAHIYKTLQEYGFESIDEITNAELETLVKKLVVEKFDTTVDILDQLVDMSLFNKVVIPVGQTGLNHFLSSEDSEFKDFNNIIKLTSLSIDDWKADFTSLVEIGKLAVEELNALSLDLKQMDITSDDAILAMQTIVEKVLSLNLLGNDKTKNELLLAVFKKFDLFNEEDLYYVEYGTDNRVSILDKVNWSDVEDNIGEITTFKNLIACFGRFANLEYVDIANMQFDFNTLLDDEEAVEIIIDALEELVDSELVMQLLSPAVNKYVLPITDKYDDDHLIKDIVNEIGPGTAVTEIAKILQAFKSAQNLGLFKVASKGLSAIEYQKEEDIHNIINTIFDSKLFEGYEGRIIRIVLKATKLLDVEKGLLNDLDYTNEQYLLNGFIYILNGKDPSDPDNISKQTVGILNDPEFQLTDEDGNLSIDIEYFLQPEKFDLLMSGLELLLGTFERDENQAFIEKDGSNLIVTLLPNIYDKYGKDLVPAEFSELVDLLGVDDLTGDALASDIRKLVYVARQLVDMDIQTLFVGGSIKYTDKLENMYNIIDALFSVQMIRPNQNAILAWTLNYVGEKLENTIKLEKVTAEQFEGLDLDSEGEIAKEVITNVVKFLEKNELTTTEELLTFINNQDYLTTNFVTEENASEVINILEGLTNLKLLECLSPVFFQALVNRLVENELIEDFWEENITGKQIMDDLKSILAIAHIAVDDIKFVELWRDNFEGNVAIPSAQPVNKIIDKLFNLNLVSGYEAKLLEFALGKVLPEDFPVEAKELGLSEISNWKNEVSVIKTIVESALGILEHSEFVLIKELLEFNFNDTDRIMELVNATNTNYVASVVEALSTSALAGKLIEPGFDYVLDKVVSPMGYNLEFLKDITSVELLQDLHRIAEALRAFAKHPTLYDLFDPNSSDFDDVEVSEIVKAAKPILVEVGSLNILNKHSSELLSLVLNEVLTMVNLTDIEISADDFVNTKLSEDFVVLTEIIDILYSVLTNYEVTVVSDAMAFVEEVTNDFTILIENDTVLEVAHVLEKLASMGIVKAVLPQAVEYGISIATDNNFDISFLLDVELTGEELGNDIIRLANVVVDLVTLHAVDLYNEEVVNYFEKEVVADVVEQLANINLLNKAKVEWASFVVNYLLQTLNIEFMEPINALLFTNVNFTEDKELIKAGLVNLVSGIESLFNYTSGGVSIDGIKNFIEYELYLDEASYTDATIKYLFSGLGSIVSINTIDAILPEALRYGLDQLSDANIEILENIPVDLTNFALGELDLSELTSKELGEFITDLGDVAVALLDFGALEYVNTQDIVDICLAKLLPAIEALAYTPLISNRINGVLALSTTILTNVLNFDVNVEAADFGDVNIENAVEKLGEVLRNGDVLLASLELASIQEIIDFASAINLEELSVRGNIRESAYALVDVLRPLFEIEVLQTVLPKIALFGIKQIPDYDLEFIRVALLNGEVSGYGLSSDVLSILDIVELLVEFNAIEIYSNIESGDLDIELKLDIVVEIISIIENLNVLKYDYNNWALFISNLFDDSIELDEFASMTNELWAEDFNTLREIVKNVDKLLSDNELTTIQSVIDFVQNETYITYQAQYLRDENVYLILDIVENVASINMIDPIIIRLAQNALEQFVVGNDNLPDLYFVVNAIDDEVYMGKDLKDDVLVLISILRDLVEFGALDYYCFGEIEEINTELLSQAVEKLETLKLYEISKEQWLIIGINEIFKLLDIESLDGINLAYVDNQFTSIAKVIYDLGQVFDYLNIVSTNDIKVMIEDQMYMDSSYYNEVTLHSIINVLEDVTNIPVLNAIALPLGLWGLQQANVTELEFLTEALERGVEHERISIYSHEETSPLTSPELTQDLKAVVEILRNAVNFGAQDIIYDIRVEEINAEYLENIVSLVANLNVYRKLRAEWLNYGLGKALESLEISVSVEDFEGIASDEEAFKVIVKELCSLVESLDIKCITDAKEFIDSEAYYNDFVFGEPLNHVENILTNLVSTNIVNAIYDKLLSYGIGLLGNIDVSFIEGIYTNDLLVEDISTLVEIVRIAHEFGVADIIKTKTVGEINLEYVVDALNEVDKLNLLNIARPEWFTLGLNQVYAMLEISDEVEVSDFDGHDVDSEIQNLIALVNALDLLMRELELTTYGDIQDFIACQEYLNTTHMSENVFNYIIDALDAATDLAIVEVSISTFATYGMQQANIEELTFLTEALEFGKFTNPELISDIKVLVDILRNAVEFGIVDIIFDVRLEEIKSENLTNIIKDIAELNVYNELRAEWLGYGLGMALSSIEVEVSAEDFVGIPSDKASFVNAVEALCRLVESLDIMCLTDANNFIENKEYISKDIYTEENFNEIETILTNLISTNIVNAIFDKLLTRGIELLETVDISFVDGVYTHELLVEDIHSLVVIVKNAVQFGALEYVGTNDIEEIDVTYIKNIVAEIENLNLFTLFRAEWVALGLSYVTPGLGIELAVRDLETLTEAEWLEDNTSLQDVIMILDDLINELSNPSLKQLIDYYSNFASERDVILTDNCIDIYGNVLSELTTLNTLELIFPNLVILGIEAASQYDISIEFMNEITLAIVHDDVDSLVKVFKNLVHFGLFEYLDTDDIEVVKMEYVKNILAELENLGMYTLFRADWINLALSYISPDFAIEISAEDFEALTDAEWLEDNQTLQQIVMMVNDVITELGNPSLKELIDLYSNLARERDTLLTDGLINVYANMLSEATTLNVFEAIYGKLLSYVIDIVAENGVDITFMSVYGLHHLHEDIPALVEIFKNAVHFGLFEYLDTKDIKEINVTYVKNIVALLENINLFTLFRTEWVALGLSYVTPKLGIDVFASDFALVTEAQWKEDNLTLQNVVMILDDLINELYSPTLSELINYYSNFVLERDTLLTSICIDIYGRVLSEITTLNTLEVVFPKLLEFGISKASEHNLDIEFIETLTLENVHDDVDGLVEIFKNAVFFGLFEYIDTNDIEEVNARYIKNIIAELDDLNIYRLFRSNWVALVLSRVTPRFGFDVTTEDLDTLTSEEWLADNQTLQQMVMFIDDIVAELDNPTLKELINIYSNYANERDTIFTDSLIDIYGEVLRSATTLNLVELMFPNLLVLVIDAASERNIDISFINALTLDIVHDDVDSLVNVFKNAVHFGLFEYVDTKDIEVVNMEYVKNMVAEVENFGMYTLFRSNWIEIVLSYVSPKLFVEVTYADFESLTDADWLEDNQTLQEIIMMVNDIIDELGSPSLKELIDLYSNFSVERDVLLTDELIDVYANMLSEVTTLNVFEAIYGKLLSQVIEIAAENGIDITFMSVYGLHHLYEDIPALVKIFKNAVHFGLFEYLDTNDIEVVNMEFVKDSIAELENLNLYTLFRAEWATLVLNRVSSRFGIDVFVNDFASVTETEWKEDNLTLQNIVMMVNDIIAELDSPSLKELISTYVNFASERDTIFTDNLIDIYGEILSEVTLLNMVEAVYPKLLSVVVDKAAARGLDIRFLEDTLTLAHIHEDVDGFVEIFKNAVHFGLFEYLDTNDIEVVNMEYVKNIVAELENLNVYTLFRAEWVARVFNRVTPRFGFDVTTSDFEVLTEAEWQADNAALQNMVDVVAQLISEFGTPTLKEFASHYINFRAEAETLLTDDLLDLYADLLSEVTSLNMLEIIFPNLLVFAIDKASDRNIDITFINILTLEHVHEDVDGLVEIVKNIVKFGLFEYLDTNDIANVNMEYVKASVAELENLNVYTLFRAEWVARVFNRVTPRFGFDVTTSDFEVLTEAEWQADNAALQNMVDVVAQLISEFGTPTLKEFASHYINFRAEAETLLTDDLLDLYADLLSEVTSLNMLEIIFPNLLVFAIDKASDRNIDITFINILTLEHVHEDVDGLVEIVKNIVKFGLFEYLDTNDIANVNMEYVKASVAELENLNVYTLFRAEWVARVFNRVTPRFGFDVTTSDFEVLTEAEWQADNAALQNMVDVVAQLISELGNPTLKGLVSLYMSPLGERATILTDNCLDLYEDILSEATSLNMVDVIFPNLLVFAIDKASEYNLDIEFINGTVTLDHVHADVDNIIAIAKSLIHFGTLEILLSNTDELVIDVTILNEVITEAGLLETYRLDRENWIATLINFVVARTSYSARVDASDFVGIDWDRENLLLQDIVNSINTLLVNMDLVKYNDIINTVKDVLNKVFVDEYLEPDILEDMLDVVDATVNSQIVGTLIPMVTEKVINRVKASRGYDLSFVLETTTDEELVEDVHTMISAVRDLVRFNIVRLYLNGTEIDYNEMPLVYSAITKLSGLNVVKGNENNFVRALFERHDIDTGCLSVGTINGVQEAQTLIEILEVLVEVLKSYDLYALNEIRYYNYRGIRFDNNTDSNLNAIADILTIIAEDNMFEMVVFALSERYVPAKYNGILDIHNIYSEYTDLYTDMLIGADIIRTVANLHVTEIKNGTIDIPFSDTASAEIIIRSICNLNYFNLPGRIAKLVSAVDSLYPGKGISYIDGNNIDLASDADKFVEMYNIFAGITTRPGFPIKNRFDINRENISVRYFLQKDILNELVDMAKVYMDTTVYEETGPVILAILLPIVKVYAPEYWNALDLDNYNVDKIRLDMPVFENIAKTIKDLDLRGIVSGEIVLDGLDATINSLITDAASLELFKGHLNALTKVLLKDFVYGKHIAGIAINEGAFDIDSVDFDADIEVLKDIITEVFSILNVENVKTLNELKSYVKGFSTSQFLENEEAVKDLADIVELAAQSTFVKFNVKQVYTSVVLPRLENMNRAQYVDYRNATNEEIIADLIVVAEIIRKASTLGLGDVMTGGNINYDQADTITEILKLVGQMNVVRLSTDAYINYLSTRFEGLRTYGASYETLDIAHDFELIGLAYAEVAGALNANFAYRTLSELRTISLSGLLDFAKNNVNEVVNATEYIAQLSIVPYLVPTVIDRFNSLTSGTVLNNVLATIKPYEVPLSVYAHDATVAVDLVRNLLDSDILAYVVNKSGEIVSAECAKDMIDNVMSLELFKDHYAAILTQLLTNLSIDVSGYDLTSINYETEAGILADVISEILLAVNEYGLTHYEQIKPELASYKNVYTNEGMKEFLKAVRNALVKINAEHIVNVVELIDESEFVDLIIIPIYNGVINIVPESYRTYLELGAYNSDDVSYDTHLVALAIRSLYESEIYKEFTTNEHVGRECVPYLEDVVRYIAQLRIIDMKKQDLVNLAGKLLGLDVSALDVSGINIADDAEILINAMDDVYTAFKGTNKGKFRINMLGDTPTMEAIINVLAALESTTTLEVFIPWIANTYVLPRMNNLVNSEKLNNVSDEKILSICDDCIAALYALLEMGAFSNDGIDLTNKELTGRVFAVVYNNINLGKYQKYFDKLTRNIASYGVLPVDYSVMSTQNEISAMVATLRELRTLISNYGGQIRALDLNVVNNPQFEIDVTNVLKQALNSQFVSQVFMNIVNGSTMVATENYGKFSMFEGMTSDEFVNVALPDIFDIIGYVADLGVLSGSVNYKDTDTIMKLVRKVVESPVTNGHLDELVSLALRKVANIDIDKQVFKDANIDYNLEADYLEAFLNGLDLNSIDITNSSSLKSEQFLSDVSVAGRELIPSKVFGIIIKPVMKIGFEKVGSTNPAVDAFRQTIDSADYTDAMAMADYEALLEIAGLVANMGIFSGINFDNADNLGTAIKKLFATNLASGNEKVLMEQLLKKMSFVETDNIDLDLVTDWDNEIDKFASMLDALTTLCKNPQFDVDNISSDALNDPTVQDQFVEYVDAASKTYIGSEIFKELYKNNIVPILPADARDIIDIDTLPTDKWAKEIEELLEIYELIGSSGQLNASSLTANSILSLYDIIFGLNGKDGIESVKNNRKVWLKKFINEDSLLQGSSATLNWNDLPDNDQAAQEAEVLAIRAFLNNIITGYVDNPETARISDISYDSIVECKDYNKLYDTFIVMSKSVVMRNVLISTIDTGVSKNSNTTSVFNLSRMISAEFKDQVTNGYNSSFWSDEEYFVLAVLLASANAFDLVHSEGIFYMDLGTTYADINTYVNIPGHLSSAASNFPSQELETATERKVGFRQILQLMNLSKVFDLGALDGNDGIISELFTINHVRPLGTVENTKEAWDKEINDLTESFKVLKDAGLLDSNINVSSYLRNEENDNVAELEKLLKSINHSDILRPILAEQMHKALAEAIILAASNSIYNGTIIAQYRDNEKANSLISSLNPWLHQEWGCETSGDPLNPLPALSDEATYDDKIVDIITLIKNPSSMFSGLLGA